MSINTEVRIFSTPQNLFKAVANEIMNLTTQSNQSAFHVALPGGNTPRELFTILAKEFSGSIPWKRVHFWWGDERCVPPEDQQSNYKMARDVLFTLPEIQDEQIHRIRGEEDPSSEADRYSSEIEKWLNRRGNDPVFDLVILGLGEDGHTASIFPDQIELFEDPRSCAPTVHPITGQPRITLTGRVLNNASRIFFLVTGESKAQRVSEIMNDDEAAKLLPAYYISPKNGILVWFLDDEAAARIK